MMGYVESEVIEEITAQLEECYRGAIAAGASQHEADARARDHVSDWQQLAADITRSKRKQARSAIDRRVEQSEIRLRRRGGPWIAVADVLQGLNLTLRRLRRTPGFTAVVIFTLAIGIGANTAIFSLVNGILLKPLPYSDAERLVTVRNRAPGLQAEGRADDLFPQSPAVHFTYVDEARAFESVGLWTQGQATVEGTDGPERISTALVTAGTLPTLRVQPFLGRTFTVEDNTPGSPFTIILSHDYWQRRFGGDPDVIGQTLYVSDRSREVIGVMPRGFRFLEFDPDIYRPLRFDRSTLFVGNFTFRSIARLNAGVTIEAALADLTRLLPLAIEKFPGGMTLELLQEAQAAPVLRPLRDEIVGDIGTVLWVLLGTVGIVLLIACANVANLFMVRAEIREQEMAIRSALGAGRRQIAGLYLLESTMLGLLGGALGLGLAYGGLRLLTAIAPGNIPRLDEISLDPAVLAFTLGISVLSGIVFGLLPVLRWGRGHLVQALKEGGRGSSSGRERHRTRNALVVGQIALALVLVVGSGLMIRTIQALRQVTPGFRDAQEVLAVLLTIPSAQVAEPEQVALTFEAIARRIEAVGGVTSVGLSSSITMDRMAGFDPIFVEEFPLPEGQLPATRRFKWIGGGYSETMGNNLVAGRSLTWADIHARARVLLVTENLAREYWSDPADAIGKRIGTGFEPGNWREIIGVVGDVRDDGIMQDPVGIVYWPMLLEDFWPELRGDAIFLPRTMWLVVRSSRVGTDGFLNEVRDAIWAVNPNLPLSRVQTMADVLRSSLARTSFTLVMLGLAASVALFLGVVGVYGVVSYVVSQRTREIGLRIALGADAGKVAGMVLQLGMVLALIGVALGLAAAYGLTRLMSGLLYGVSAVDPVTFGAVALCLGAVVLLASYLPARRASRVDPMEALRVE
jgi:predicted permease